MKEERKMRKKKKVRKYEGGKRQKLQGLQDGVKARGEKSAEREWTGLR